MRDLPKPGEVWDYPYLWARQARGGEAEGRKPRPVAVSVVIERTDGRHWAVFLAITSKAPDDTRPALAVPEMERRRAGLDPDLPLWIILDEHNRDCVELSYYLEPDALRGSFSGRFLKILAGAFADAIRAGRSTNVDRT
ncbi:MAG: hypothetical protein KDK53_04610 [Maritimibacter sp.]|nr:hypothetical protein [Maritimibacter sp.]